MFPSWPSWQRLLSGSLVAASRVPLRCLMFQLQQACVGPCRGERKAEEQLDEQSRSSCLHSSTINGHQWTSTGINGHQWGYNRVKETARFGFTAEASAICWLCRECSCWCIVLALQGSLMFGVCSLRLCGGLFVVCIYWAIARAAAIPMALPDVFSFPLCRRLLS